jgi:hypothetical protein
MCGDVGRGSIQESYRVDRTYFAIYIAKYFIWRNQMPHTLPPIDDDIFAALQARAQPLVDDVNSVLRRLLGLEEAGRQPAVPPSDGIENGAQPDANGQPKRKKASEIGTRRTAAKRSKKSRAGRGTTLPDTEFEIPVLQALDECGGRAPAAEVTNRVGEILDERLGDVDRDRLAGGDVRWRNRVQFARLRLVQAGDLASDSPRGTWEITDQGRTRLAERSTK